ncbi:MAG: hypothetical protein M0D55_03285 [Elusimicrobiota bacterium]|nr:MAG: hypothetical protein M0D55_03285 [Elusimicrobiota bacterium]
MTTILACLLVLAPGAFAHQGYPIPPARGVLRVEPGRAVLDLRVDSIYFIEEVVGLHPMPPRDWPADALAKVEAYVGSHLSLEAGGRVLPGRLAAARYRQLPWEVTEEGTFFLRLEYPLPSEAAGDFVLTSRLYDEYRKEMAQEYPQGSPFKADYRLLLDVPGRVRSRLELLPGVPARLGLADVRRRPAAMAAEAFGLGAGAAFGVAAAFPALIGLGVWLAAGAGSGRRAHVLLAVAAVAGAWAAAARGAPGWAAWASLLAAALAARFAGHPAGTASAAAAAAALGAIWGADVRPVLPATVASAPAAAAGVLAGAAPLLAAAAWGAGRERERMREISESRAGELFVRRARLAATILALIGGYGLWLNLNG